MFSRKKFTITIGDYGCIVVLHDTAKKIKKRLLVASLDKESQKKLTKLFNTYRFVPIYILLDTADQNYKRRMYPLVNIFDLHTLIAKDIKKEVIHHKEDVIENHITHKIKILRKWECIFISAPYSSEIKSWKEFLMQLNNRIVGIYMLPLEIHALIKKIAHHQKHKQHFKKKNNITSLFIQNKVSGTRQVVFSNDTIIFTRVVNYNFEDTRFLERFEQDIFIATEYLKRTFPDTKIEDINFINILPQKIIEKVNNIQNKEFNFINLTPHEVAKDYLNIPNLIPQNSNFADILISHIFANTRKKMLTFFTPQIKLLEKFYLVIRSFFTINVILCLVFLGFVINLFIYMNLTEKKMESIEHKKSHTEATYKNIRKSILSDHTISDLELHQITDFGKIDAVLSKNHINILQLFKELTFVKQYGVIVKSFSYKVTNHQPKSANVQTPKITFSIAGSIEVKSGDVEELFKKFDNLTANIKLNYKNYNIKYTELPVNIDFSKKYYTFPINLTMSSR